MNADDFSKWVQGAMVGDRITYHTGSLASDIEKTLFNARATGSVSEKSKAKRMTSIRGATFGACKAGTVALFQKRIGYMHFEYVAVRL